MSSIATSKDELLLAITIAKTKLLADYQTIPAEFSRVVDIEGNIKNTLISVCDTLAYLIGWGKLVIKWHIATVEKQEIALPADGVKWNELGKLALQFYVEYQDWSFTELLEEFEKTENSILAIVSSLSEEALYGRLWYRRYSFGRMIQLNTASPMKSTRTKVRKFKKQLASR